MNRIDRLLDRAEKRLAEGRDIVRAHERRIGRPDRRVEVRWPQVDERRQAGTDGRRFDDEPVLELAPEDIERPYSPCQWADVPTGGFL